MLKCHLDAGVDLPGIGAVEGIVQAAELPHRCVGGVNLYAVTGVVILGQETTGGTKTGGDDVEERSRDAFRHFLVEARDGDAGLSHQLAA